MRTLMIFILSVLSMHAWSQCPKYDHAISKGNEYLYQKEPYYDKALIEFQAAQIAARECGMPIDLPRQKLDSVFIGLKNRRDEAVAAKHRAEVAEMKSKTAFKLANDARIDAEEARDTALYFRKRAEEQKADADSFARDARRERNFTASLNLALQSTLTEDSIIKIERALQAYDLNKTNNNGNWMPEITRALLGSNVFNSIHPVLKLNSGIIDIFKIGNGLYVVTDSGELRSINMKAKTSRRLWNDPEFYYLNNSWKFDSTNNRLSLRGKGNKTYFFATNSDSLTFDGARRSEVDSVFLSNGEYVVLPGGLFQVTKDSIQERLQLRNSQFASALMVSPNKELVALGTGDGWLYVFERSPEPTFSRQFQLEKTRVNDILFDRKSEFIATAGNDGRVRLNKVEFINERAPIELDMGSWVNGIFFLDSMELLIGTKDGTLYVLNFNQDRLAMQSRKIINPPKQYRK